MKKKKQLTSYEAALRNLYWLLVLVMFGVVVWLGFEAAMIIKAEVDSDGRGYSTQVISDIRDQLS